jgi:molecular chaperone Hsp33
LVYRLFNSLGAHIQPTRAIQDKCRCSPEKVEVMLDGLSAEQRGSLADENGQLVVSCEFCKTDRSFDLTAI